MQNLRFYNCVSSCSYPSALMDAKCAIVKWEHAAPECYHSGCTVQSMDYHRLITVQRLKYIENVPVIERYDVKRRQGHDSQLW